MGLALNHYRTLGRSGLRVSPLCLGTMTFGDDWGWGAHVDTCHQMLDHYLEVGGNFIDTANIYTKGHSEVILGDYFKERGGRDGVVLATKFCGNLHTGDPNAGGASRKSILTALEYSLRRLRTNHVDLYWMHFHDPNTPVDETMRALDDLVSAGKVRHIGFSDTPAWKVVQAQYEAVFRNWVPLIALQIEYSLLERTVEADLIPMACEMGLGVTPWSPLKGGLLSGKYGRSKHPEGEGRVKPDSRHLNEMTFRLLDELEAIAREVNSGAAQVALAWVLNRPGVASPIIGVRTLEQLKSNLKALGVGLSEDQLKRLNAVSEPTLPFPHAFLQNTKAVMLGGTTINGISSEPWALAPRNDAERW